MAGEWIGMDVCLPTKPEFLEIQEATGATADQVAGRLFLLWGWASMNTADGTLRGTPARLAKTFGGDEQFWRAVEAVGWISFSDEARTLTVAGWDRRFSKSAKSRMLDSRRKAVSRAKTDNVRVLSGSCPASVRVLSGLCPVATGPEERREEERREEEKRKPPSEVAPTETRKPRSRSQPSDAIRWTPAAGWEGITDADRAEWREAFPAVDQVRQLAAMGQWLKANPEKAKKSRWRAFVVRWLSREQERGGGVPSNRPGSAAPLSLDEKLAIEAREARRRKSWRSAPPGCPDDLAGRFFNRMMTDGEYAESMEAARSIHRERRQDAAGRANGQADGSGEPAVAVGPENASQSPTSGIGSEDDSAVW
jgi:hypothetical protein